MKVVVCGGRNFGYSPCSSMEAQNIADLQGRVVFEQLDRLHEELHFTKLINGKCPTGVDKIATEWAKWAKVPVIEYRADWNRFGLAAGPMRNQQMLDEENPDYVISFPGGRGTADMISRAKGQGFKTIEVVHDGD